MSKKNVKVDELTIDGTVYVPKDSTTNRTKDGLKCVVVRGRDSGVQYGYLQSRDGREVVLRHAIRIWYWKGAASLSQLAVDGVKNPDDCKFSVPVDTITVLDAIEIIDVTERASEIIENTPSWKE